MRVALALVACLALGPCARNGLGGYDSPFRSTTPAVCVDETPQRTVCRKA